MEDLLKNNEKNISKNQILEYNESQDIANPPNESVERNTSINIINIEDSQLNQESFSLENDSSIEEASLDPNDEPEKIETETASTTNCLALTIKEEHKLVAIKNVCIHSLKVTWKVIASTIALHILKIFF